MDLKEFVKEALTQLAMGVQEAQSGLPHGAGTINPCVRPAGPLGGELVVGGTHVQDVQFDVAVTASERSDIQGDAGVRIAVVNFGGKGGTSTENSSVSRLKFTVPIALPVGRER